MNKKRLLPLIASVVMSAAFCLAGCGGCNGCNGCNVEPEGPGGDNPPVVDPETPITTELVDIDVDTSKVKTSFYVGENFSSSRLVVKALTKRSDRDTTQTRDVSASAKINSNAYRRTRVGEYVIKVSYTLGSITKEKSYKVTVKDVNLEFDTTEVETSYLVGQDLDISKLKVKATTTEYGKEPVTEDITSSQNLTIDSSAYDKTKEGTYPIKATYSLPGGVIRTASFDVTAVFTKEGFNVSLAAGVSDTVNLSGGNKTASIDVSNIVVKPVNARGEVIDEPIVDGGGYENYKVELYKGNEKLTPSSGTVYSDLPSGTYQIWVSADSKTVEGYTISGFALIYVVEDIVPDSFTKTSTDDTTQNIGVDTITKNWKYEIKYAAEPDVPVEITADKVTVTGFNPLIEGTRTATATYTYKLANGVEKKATVNVSYTIVKGENQTKDEFAFVWAEDSDNSDKGTLTQEYLDGCSGNKSFLTLLANATAQYRYKSSSSTQRCIEIRYDALKVNFSGVGTLELDVSSTGGGSTSSIGVKRVKETDGENPVYEYISAEFTSSELAELVYGEGCMYQVTDSGSSKTLKFIITEPGEYIIFTRDANPEDDAIYARFTRVQSIRMTDVHDKTV